MDGEADDLEPLIVAAQEEVVRLHLAMDSAMKVAMLDGACRLRKVLDGHCQRHVGIILRDQPVEELAAITEFANCVGENTRFKRLARTHDSSDWQRG